MDLPTLLPAHFKPTLPLLVGYSGGADSTALLHACATRWVGQVAAVHVHHGLQQAADDFLQQCQQQCAEWDVPLHIVHVDAQAVKGDSPENAARNARYQAFIDTLRAHPQYHSIALAQHADDQIETLLLALSRGAGLPGLSAMPRQWQHPRNPHLVEWHRPLLERSADELKDYLRAHDITWIDDPTNNDQSYTRNRIRHQLLPALESTFPQFRTTFSRSIAHIAQAQELTESLAANDLTNTGAPPRIKLLQQLSNARLANLLRHWLKTEHATQASTTQLHELIKQIHSCTTRGHRIQLKIGHGWVQRQRGHLRYSRTLSNDDT